MSTQNTLNEHQRHLLRTLKIFPSLDKGSQLKLRKEIDEERQKSKLFADVFRGELGALAGAPKERRGDAGLLGTLAEVVLHPVTAVKAKVGETLIKRRNKAVGLLKHPHPTLSAVAERWNFRTEKKEDLIEIVRKLGATLRGVNYGDRLGMAAPQIGISKRVFVCQGAVCVNPRWAPPKVSQKIEVREGCYSLPDGEIWKVQRDKYGWATWFSVDGEVRQYKLTGLNAIVYQHELDHLDGKCCCDIGVKQE